MENKSDELETKEVWLENTEEDEGQDLFVEMEAAEPEKDEMSSTAEEKEQETEKEETQTSEQEDER